MAGQAATIVGVMPASFRFPGEDVEIWTAVRNEMDGTPRNVRFWAVVGRLSDGVTAEAATAEVASSAASSKPPIRTRIEAGAPWPCRRSRR